MRVKSTAFTLFEDEASRTAPQRTFHIFGVNRGGTSAVAGVMNRIGLYLGEDMGATYEDKSFRARRGLESIRGTIEERNASHDIWGWKHPHSGDYLRKILPDLRNPRLVFVTRDLTANALGIGTRGPREDEDAIKEWMGRTRQHLRLVKRRKLPTLFISYEKLLIRPELAVQDLAGFLNRDPSSVSLDELMAFLEPGRYKRKRKEAAGSDEKQPAQARKGLLGLRLRS